MANKQEQLEKTRVEVDEQPEIHDFVARSGLQVPLDPANSTVIEYIELFLTEEFYEKLFLTKLISTLLNLSKLISKTWKPTSAKEIRHFLALYMLTGIIQKPQIKQ